MQGIVAGEPDTRDTYTNLRVDVRRLKPSDEADWHEVHGTVLVRAPRYPAYNYGDELEIAGRIETPPELDDFSYREYLERQGIGSIIYRPQITYLSGGHGGPLYYLYAPLYALKARAQSTIETILPEPQASLLAGILLGVRATIPPDLMADFSTTGTSHIVAISGFNIAIISCVFASFAQRLVGKRWSWVFALAGVALFTLMVGASAAVVRAAVMGCLTILAGYVGRRSDAWAALAAAGLVMAALDPWVLWDLGFQLSFLATLGLMVLSPPLVARAQPYLAALFGKGPPGQWLTEIVNDSLLLTLAAQVTTLPVILVAFGNLSLVAPLTNLLILPAQPAIMLWGALAAIAGMLFAPAGQLCGWVAWVFLTYTVEAVRLTARLPLASLNVGRLNAWVAAAYYAALAGGFVIMQHESLRARLRGLWDTARSRITFASLAGALRSSPS
ncbi:MAG: ComEC family competence protein [Chloroflexi bacterium]|nr:ComEC family competence protein [Chloroflexota bacterium]MBU1748752.1 ComEC family competence protein [Chloroflexota bacterium]